MNNNKISAAFDYNQTNILDQIYKTEDETKRLYYLKIFMLHQSALICQNQPDKFLEIYAWLKAEFNLYPPTIQ